MPAPPSVFRLARALPREVRAWAVAAAVALLVAPSIVHAQGSTAPEITSTGPFTVSEGETAVATLTATDSDTDAASLTWSKSGGADSDAFTLSNAGVLAFAAAKDYEEPDDSDEDGSYEVTVQVSDGTDTDTANLVVTLENVIELAITGESTVSFAENGAGRVATFSAASDADSDGLAWTITGDDADHFTIDSPPGALRFHIGPVSPNLFPSPPDFEDPADADTSNDYSISLLAQVGSDVSSAFAVTVTVTDVDEAGVITLSTTRPSAGSSLTATLSDPDGVTDGTTTWQWDRSAGRNRWVAIAGADSANYTPTAADTDSFLRVKATYGDTHGPGNTATATTAEVVTAQLLSSLMVTTTDSDANPDRALRPAFDAKTLHYAIGCTDGDTMTLTPSAPSGARLAVNGVQVLSGSAIDVPVFEESNVLLTVSGSDGASTTYVMHCVQGPLSEMRATKTPGASGVIEELLLFARFSDLVIADNNGVPRFHRKDTDKAGGFIRVFRVGPEREYRYAYPRRRSGGGGREWVFLDQYLNGVGSGVTTAAPLTHTDGHDFRILENGNYLLIAYEPATRDLSGLTFDHPEVTNPSSQATSDSAIQIVTPSGQAVFTWSSWKNIPLEDCSQHRFPVDYSHINSVQMADGYIIGGFRGCSTVLAIDPDHPEDHKVVWRVGLTNLSTEEWESRDIGPAPLTIVGDPVGQFCGQHAAEILPSGRLILYDNGVACVENPWDGQVLKEHGEYSRAVEYALDLDHGEAVFMRDHSLHGARLHFGYSHGNVEVMANGDWLVSWGNSLEGAANPPDESVTQVDPDTGTEKFSLILPSDRGSATTRALRLSPVALATEPVALTAEFPASTSTSVFHTGASDSPQVVVAFSRPVVDFDETSPSLSVSGATVDGVSAHIVAGEQANAYLVTLTPDGDGAITFSLVANQACDSDGICASDGTTLTRVPAALVIGAPVTVSFGQAAYSVSEGSTLSVTVQLSAAHQGVRGVTIPVELDATTDADGDDLTADDSVTFAAGETSKTLTVEALDDDLVEGSESATLEFGTLPHGVTAGSTSTVTLSLTDADEAEIAFTTGASEIAEGGQTQLSFAITNGVTFEDDQTVELTITGTATESDDFTLVDALNQTLSAPYAVIFPAGAISVEATIRAVDDADIEDVTETITVSGRLGLTGVTLATRTVRIPPSDVPGTPVVTIAPGSTVTEGADATFTLSRTASTNLPLSDPLTVSVEVTATGSTLDGSAPTAVRFEGGEGTADLVVRTLDDSVVEPPGSVTALVRGSTSNPPVYLTGAVNSATLTVDDNDVAAFTLSAGAEEVAEGSTVVVTIAADGVSFAEAQTLTLTLAGTATESDDFTLAAGGEELSDPYTVTLPAGAASVAVTIQTVGDDEDDVGETVELSASHDGNTIGTVTVTIAAPAPAPIGTFIGFGGGGGPTGPEPSDEDFEWTVEHDIEELANSHEQPSGSWSDGVTLWLLDNPDGAGDAVYAYDLATGERAPDREFELAERNRAPRGVWSDGATTWVSDSGQDKLFAHDTESGERLPERDIALASRNADPRGIWSDGETIWVLDGRRDALFAYDLDSGELLGECALDEANDDPRGIWSDRTTVWVSNHDPKRLFAYRLPTRAALDAAGEDKALERVQDEEFTELSAAGNNSPRGLWSDGDVMYVADANDGKVYSYNMPDAIDARLASLSLEGVDIGEFDPGETDYEGVPDDGVTETTLAAEAAQDGASVVIDPPDADEETEGHQVDLEGVGEITVAVTSPDGSRERVYRVALAEEEVAAGPSASCLRGAVSVGFSLVLFEGGSLEDLVGCAQGRHVTALYALQEGEYVSYIVGAPDFTTARFRSLFADGVPALLPLVVSSEGPATPAPAAPEVTEPFAVCLRGEIAAGFSLVAYEGGSVADLEVCAAGFGVTAVYALAEGEYVPYILGAPEFVTARFRALFPDGVPSATPLTVRGERP